VRCLSALRRPSRFGGAARSTGVSVACRQLVLFRTTLSLERSQLSVNSRLGRVTARVFVWDESDRIGAHAILWEVSRRLFGNGVVLGLSHACDIHGCETNRSRG
jgi:hypothetical protein